jgi:D-3-phosphoglycerate dehydrogenase
MIDMVTISNMKDGVRLISASRGGVINENDLLEGLESGKIAGAALDVLEKEPPSPSKLLEHPNIIVTPHIGAQTIEAQDRAGIDIVNEVIAALDGQKLRWRIV